MKGREILLIRFGISCKKIFLVLTVLLVTIPSVLAQVGSIRGRVTDAKTGETIVGASVVIEGTFTGIATNFDGEFVLPNVAAGRVNLVVTFISYETVVVDNVVVNAGRESFVAIVLEEAGLAIEEVQVVARRVTHTEMSLISSIKASNVVVSGISQQQITRSQDSDAAEVVKRIPGVTIVDDRFIMIRGLSERYNATMLHSSTAPSMEADIRSFSFDILPSNLIDRVLIFKSPSPELPGDFAGGVVKVFTRTIPDQNFISASYSSRYDANTSFRSFYRQPSGSLHSLGLNDGFHDLPSDFPDRLGAIINDPVAIQNAGRSLNNNWIPIEANAGLNHSASITAGYRFQRGVFTLGNITALNYSNSKSIDNIQRADFNDYDFVENRKSTIYNFNDNRNSQKIRTGLLHNWSLSIGSNHSFEFINLFNQLSTSEYVFRTGDHYEFDYYANNHSFYNLFRGLYSGQLSGKHTFLNGSTTLSWTAAYGTSFRDEPDYRRYRSNFDTETGAKTLYVPFGAAQTFLLGRFFSGMRESNLSGLVSLSHRITFDALPNFVPEISVGAFVEDKSRSFSSRNLGYVRSQIFNFDQALLDQPIDVLFSPENINPTTGLRIDEQTNPSDSYESWNRIRAGYAMVNIPITRKLRLVTGLRIEDNEQGLSSATLTNEPIEVNYPIMSLLPSANLSYNFTERMLLRFAYGKTLNRPEFRELAPFGFYDFNYNLVRKGNPFLGIANIHNFDIRWELYPTLGEVVSVGLFQKNIEGPIETQFTPGGGTAGIKTFTYENATNAISQGVEVEIRKSLSGFTPFQLIDDMTILLNTALIKSRVDLGTAGLSQDELTRAMMGQSPYIVNAGLYYSNTERKLQVNVLYNVIGQRIFMIGRSMGYPEIYEMPRNLLEITVTKGIGKNLELKMGIKDIINNDFMLSQTIDGKPKTHILEQYNPGTTFNLGISLKL